MYSETLTTPHPNLRQAETPITTLPDRIAAATIGETDPLRKADLVINAVRSALRYPDRRVPGQEAYWREPILLPFDRLPAEQLANCVGYSLVASEGLDQVGVDHWFGYANGHVFLLVPDYDKKQLHLRDPLFPGLNQETSDSISRNTFDSMVADMQQFGRAAAKLRTDDIAYKAGYEFDDLASRAMWVKFSKEKSIIGGSTTSVGIPEVEERAKYSRERTILVSTFPKELGRPVVHAFVEFHRSLAENDYQAAANHLASMAGLYPELDARQSHQEIKKLVNGLCQQEQFHMAAQAITHYFGSFPQSNDSRLHQLESDRWKKLYQATNDHTYLERAIAKVEQARTTTRLQKAAASLGKKLVKLYQLKVESTNQLEVSHDQS